MKVAIFLKTGYYYYTVLFIQIFYNAYYSCDFFLFELCYLPIFKFVYLEFVILMFNNSSYLCCKYLWYVLVYHFLLVLFKLCTWSNLPFPFTASGFVPFMASGFKKSSIPDSINSHQNFSYYSYEFLTFKFL